MTALPHQTYSGPPKPMGVGQLQMVCACGLLLLSGCRDSGSVEVAECEATLARLQTVLETYREPGAAPYLKGGKTYSDFKRRRFGLTESEMRKEYDALLTQPVMDAKNLLDALPHVWIEEGMALDYVHYSLGGANLPFLYSRSATAEPFADWDTYTNYHCEAMEESRDDARYLSALVTDQTAMSYFELVMLACMGGDFHISGFFSLASILCGPESFERWLRGLDEHKPPADICSQIRALDLTPYVEVKKEDVIVSFVTIDCQKHIGIRRERWSISRKRPYHLTNRKTETLMAGWASYIW